MSISFIIFLYFSFLLGVYCINALKGSSSSNDACFELPVVIVKPYTSFPTEDCHKFEPPPPRPRCLKIPIEADLNVIDHPKGKGKGKLNCLHSKPTEIHKKIKINARGDSSLGLKKHQYDVKLENEDELLGLPPHQQWIFNGPFIDGSLLRNHMAHWLYRQTGRYSPRTRHFIFYIENKEKELVYSGVYLLLEKIATGPHRLNIAENNKYCNSSQVNGGWVWQYNPLRYGEFAANLYIDNYVNAYGSGSKPVLEYPKGESLTQSMRNYFVDQETGPIPRYFNYLWNNLSQVHRLSEHIDIGSYIDYILHTEMSLNQDAYRRSLWQFKDRDQPINAGPIWDMNLAYGVGAGVQHAKVWMFRGVLQWKRLFCNYIFAGLFIQRWKTLRQSVWSDQSIIQFIEKETSPIHRMLTNCTGDWKSKKDYCVYCATDFSKHSYNLTVQVLINATRNRMHWMDDHIEELYFKCNATTCGAGDNKKLPQYNCGADPRDDGCLKNPEKYYSALEFPSVITSFSGEQCDKSRKPFEEESFDPCWYTTGTYIQASHLTPFCMGYGFCPGGPNAICKCNNKNATSDCSPINSQLLMSSQQYSISEKNSLTQWFTFVGLLAITVVVSFIFVLFNRNVPAGKDQDPLLEEDSSHYGT